MTGRCSRTSSLSWASISPEQVNIVEQHKSRRPIFDSYGVTRQIKASFGKTATMPSGAYLVIEGTEAMHVIDVNSGPKMQRRDQEASALAVNMEAAKEIARQLRLARYRWTDYYRFYRYAQSAKQATSLSPPCASIHEEG